MEDERQFERLVADLGDRDPPREEHRRRLRSQVLATVQSAGASGPTILQPKDRMSIMNRPFIRWIFAAAAIVVFAVLLSLYAGHSTAAVWADVGDNLNKAQTVSLKVTVFQGKELRNEQETSFRGNRMRVESKGSIGIFDMTSGKMLLLTPEGKSAYLGTLEDAKKQGWRNWFADLKNIVGNRNAKQIDAKKIDDRPCNGWQVVNSEGTVSVWADKKTAEIKRVEIEAGIVRTIMSDFRFNRDIDPSQFSLEPPAGYETVVKTKFAAKDASADDLVLLLRAWAGGNGNVFPDSLLDVAGWYKAAMKYDWSKETQDEKTMESAISRAFFSLGGGQGWVYRGKGVKLGDKKAAVYWTPAGNGKYRVIYGDLTVRLVDKKELPSDK
jgi:outer membrane lipoprotein-sorting protein